MTTKGAVGGSSKKNVTPERFEELKLELLDLVKSKCNPLPNEPNFGTCDKTLTRFLRARKCVVKDAFKQLSHAIEWRRTFCPLEVECTWCAKQTGFHGIRQVGFDPIGRPVLYACFAQCQTLKNTAEDTITHVVYLVENALRCLEPTNDQWIIVIDCTGLTLPCCNPKLGKQFSQTFGDNYPEHLYRFYLVHHKPVLQGIWKAIRVFVDPNTAKKVQLIRKSKIESAFETDFGPELSTWLNTELALNANNISDSQRRFWQPPPAGTAHDPRGSPSYVKKYIVPLEKRRLDNPREKLTRSLVGPLTHMPHPNIVQYLNGELNNVQLLDSKHSNHHRMSEKELKEYGIDPKGIDSSDADAD